MKKVIPALALAAVATACAPRTSTEYKDTVASFPLGSVNSFTVDRSQSSVNASLRAAAEKCLNRTQSSQSMTPGLFGTLPSYANYTMIFDGTFAESGGQGELVVKARYAGRAPIGYPKDGMVKYVVTTEGSGGSTKVTTHGLSIGYRALNRAARQWAAGGDLICPRLPM